MSMVIGEQQHNKIRRATGFGDSELPSAVAPIPPALPLRSGDPYVRNEMLHDIFDATCSRFPKYVALRILGNDPEGCQAISYRELQARSLRFAGQLRAKGVKAGDRVIICLPRGLDQYVAVLGTLRLGACYVPVDWSYPKDRINYIAKDCAAVLVVTEQSRATAISISTFAVDALDAQAAAAPIVGQEARAMPHGLAYIIYTSGSTGQPKGVMITHRNICHWVRSESAVLAIEPNDKVFGGFSLAFDMSVETMWSAFFVGAELLVASEALAKTGPDIAQALSAAGITVLHVVPSLLTLVEAAIPTLRLVNLGGEACPRDLVERWARPGLRMLNTYGPTEATVTATWSELRPGRQVTIGRPLPGYTAWIVDEALSPVPPGAEGELVIGGPGVGAGYVGRQDLTAEKFVRAPFAAPDGIRPLVYRSGDLVRLNKDGEIEFIGRIDTQTKIRGFRIELAEIERVIAEDPAVAQAVVQVFRDDDGLESLATFLVARSGMSINLAAVRANVQDRLPNYMRPASYTLLKALPTLAASGKVDRKALDRPEPSQAKATEIVPPSTSIEVKLHRVWTEAFAPRPVSVLDDLFEDLGGHSLKAARLVSAIRRLPGFEGVSIEDVYAAPTIRALACRLEQRTASPRAEASAFHRIAKWKRALCIAAQTLALIPIYTVAGLQWFFPYLAYTYFAAQMDRVSALVLGGLSFIAIPPLAMALSVFVKWVVIGRFRPGDYPLWGAYYFRWWLVRRFSEVIAAPYLAGTPMIRAYYRLLGARIGKRAFIGRTVIDGADLLTIGDEAIVSDYALLAVSSVERGLLRLGRIDVGAGAFIGSMAVIGRNTVVGAGAAVEDLSALPVGTHVPSGEEWKGSPAAPNGRRKHIDPLPRSSRSKTLLINAALALVAFFLPVVAVLPIAPGLIVMIEIDWATEGYSYLLLAAPLAATYVILMCVLTVAAKRLILGRVEPGRYSLDSWFYVRFWFTQQVNDLALRLLHPIYATLYVLPWYRALGVKVGRLAEISTAAAIVPDLVEIGPESFLADAVIFGAARIESGGFRLERTRIGRRSFIGNSAVLPTGAMIGDEVLIGVLSRPPEGDGATKPNSTWFGSPPISLPRRQTFGLFDERARFNPSPRLVAARLAIEAVRVTLSLTVFLALFSLLLSIVGDIMDMADGALVTALAFPFLYLAFVLGCGFFVVALKWLVIGRYRPTMRPLWSTFVWRSELVTSTYESLAVDNLLEPLRGTPWLPVFLRLMGCRIGKRCYFDTTDITEHDLVTVGDDVAINDYAGLQTHLFEDRVMKMSSIKVGDRITIGSYAIVLYDAEICDDAQLGDLSVVMKGETLPAATSWEGSPARLTDIR